MGHDHFGFMSCCSDDDYDPPLSDAEILTEAKRVLRLRAREASRARKVELDNQLKAIDDELRAELARIDRLF